MLKIVTTPNPILTTPVKKVEVFDSSLHKLFKEMEDTLVSQVDPQGVGLAAPQVGIDKAVFITKPNPEAPTEIYINPKILRQVIGNKKQEPEEKKEQDATKKPKKKKRQKLEGCLSIKNIWGPVQRAKRVYLEYQDREGIVHKKWFTGFKAIIIQHEVDHLNGILYTQRVLEQKNHLYEERDGKLKKLDY